MRSPIRHLLILALFGPFVLFACRSETSAREIELVARDIAWSQDLIQVEPGQTVRLLLSNEGALDHDLVIKDLGVDIALAPGENAVIELVFTENGNFEYICSVPGHEEAGMVGQLIVGP